MYFLFFNFWKIETHWMIAHTRTHAPTRALTPPPLTHMYKFVHCIGASAYAYMACMRSWIWHSNRQGIHFFIDTSHTSIFLNSLILWLCIHRSSYMYFTHTCMHVFIHGIHTWHAWMNTHDMHVCKYKFIFIWHSSMAQYIYSFIDASHTSIFSIIVWGCGWL